MKTLRWPAALVAAALIAFAIGWSTRFQVVTSYRDYALVINRWTGRFYVVSFDGWQSNAGATNPLKFRRYPPP